MASISIAEAALPVKFNIPAQQSRMAIPLIFSKWLDADFLF
ncbi:MAG: hypothetical protein OFPI_40690 [Osedax symbiont Rs2]|nr:MAG: hypothetical protein OFPI_40690 [Osedax symbiont Rs2]